MASMGLGGIGWGGACPRRPRPEGEDFAFVVLRRAGGRGPEGFDAGEGGGVVGFGADGVGHGGLGISLTLAAPRRDCQR